MSEQPPPNFNAGASVLHVPPAAAHVRIEPVQGGGGNGDGAAATAADAPSQPYTPEQIKILKDYKLEPGGLLDSKIDDPTKRAFLEQIDRCLTNGPATQTITNSGCWAVAKVLLVLLGQEIQRTNFATQSRNMSSPRPQARMASIFSRRPSFAPASADTNPLEEPLLSPEGYESLGNSNNEGENNQTIYSSVSDDSEMSEVPVLDYNPKYYNINPSNYKGNNSGYGTLRINSRKGNLFSNARIGTKRIRVRGNSIKNIQGKYKAYLKEQDRLASEAWLKAEEQKAEAERLRAASKTAKNKAEAAKKAAEARKKEKTQAKSKASYSKLEDEIAQLEYSTTPLTIAQKARLSTLKAQLALTRNPSAPAGPRKKIFGLFGGRKSRRSSRKANRKTRKNRRSSRK